jgi:hypothetical protein
MQSLGKKSAASKDTLSGPGSAQWAATFDELEVDASQQNPKRARKRDF